jgi:SEC-C motif-containing protein
MKNTALPCPCPCGSGSTFDQCCGRHLDQGAPAPTAEALMRSRYSAYVRLREDYLLATWHPTTRPPQLGLTDEAPTKWLGLEVRRHEQQDADHATVEFVARYKIDGRAHRLHEVSRFVREDGRWLYVSGDVAEK